MSEAELEHARKITELMLGEESIQEMLGEIEAISSHPMVPPLIDSAAEILQKEGGFTEQQAQAIARLVVVSDQTMFEMIMKLTA